MSEHAKHQGSSQDVDVDTHNLPVRILDGCVWLVLLHSCGRCKLSCYTHQWKDNGILGGLPHHHPRKNCRTVICHNHNRSPWPRTIKKSIEHSPPFGGHTGSAEHEKLDHPAWHHDLSMGKRTLCWTDHIGRRFDRRRSPCHAVYICCYCIGAASVKVWRLESETNARQCSGIFREQIPHWRKVSQPSIKSDGQWCPRRDLRLD